MDRRSRIQALGRTRPLLPMRPGQVERRSQEYTQHGRPALFAALDVATVRVTGRCFTRHQAAELGHLPDAVEANMPPDLNVHLVTDNHGTHKAPAVKAWLPKRSRWHVRLTSVGASWLSQAERSFALPGQRQLRPGVHRSVGQIKPARA